jgi:lauroyl/myristoyl acyltransferase
MEWLSLANRLLPTGPGLRGSLRAGLLRGLLASGAAPRASVAQVERVRKNLAMAFPQMESGALWELSRRNLRSQFRFGLTVEWMKSVGRDELDEFFRTRVRVEGEEHLQAAREHDGPVIAFSAHYGVPLLACVHLLFAMEGRKRVNTFYAPPDENPSTAGYREMLEKMSPTVNTLLGDGRAVRAGLQALRRGEVLTMQPDVYDNHSGSALLVPFMGRFTFAMGGTAYFAVKSGARVVPTWCFETDRREWVIRYDAPLAPPSTGDSDADIYELTAAIFGCMEAQIGSAPEHWVYWYAFASRLLFDVRVPDVAASEGWQRTFLDLCGRYETAIPGVSDFVESYRERAAVPA